MPPRLLIRADAAPEIGSGHVMRCLALAQAWQMLGGQVTFVSHLPVARLRRRIEEAGCRVVLLDRVHPDPADLATTQALLREQGPDAWCMLDGYHFDPTYQQAIREAGTRLLVVDDMAALPAYYADIVLNQNSYAPQLDYPCGPDTVLLLGTPYVLLRREFLAYQGWERPIPDTATKLLITLGGSDPANGTLTALHALQHIPPRDLEIRVVVGPSNPYRDSLAEAAQRLPHAIELLTDVTDMPGLMAWADVALSAAGSTCWELAFMGLPALVVILAENQARIAGQLAAEGIVAGLGWLHELSEQQMASALIRLLESHERRAAMSARGQALVDGRGAEAVAAVMMGHNLLLRPVRPADCRLIWEWSNDPDVRASSFSSAPIPWESHVRWFDDQLHNPNSLFFVAMRPDREPVGQVRFWVDNGEAVISISLAPYFRRQGYGSRLIALASQRVFESSAVRLIHAYIKHDNLASVRAFARAGYTDGGTAVIREQPALHMILVKDKAP